MQGAIVMDNHVIQVERPVTWDHFREAAEAGSWFAHPMRQDASSDYRVKSGARAIQVLEFFRSRGCPARAIDVGRELELSPSSTNDLLKTLVEIGYLEFNESSKFYFIGARAAIFGHWAASIQPSVAQLNSFARELGRRTGECVVLATYCRGVMQFLIAVGNGDASPPPQVAAGLTAPVIGTAAGGAILMDMNREDLFRIAKHTYHLKKIDKVVDALFKKINDFKGQGYAVPLNEDFLPGFWTLALPLPCKIFFSPIVVGIGGPKLRIRQREQEIVAAAREMIGVFFAHSDAPPTSV
jgi:DNA-binding IclR family transcriptional regulator